MGSNVNEEEIYGTTYKDHRKLSPTVKLSDDVRLLERTNYVVVSVGKYNPTVPLVERIAPLNYLECFGNIIYGLGTLMANDKIVSKTIADEVCNFGFLFHNIQDWMYVLDTSTEMKYYTFNYASYLKKKREKRDLCSTFNHTLRQTTLIEMQTEQAYNYLLRCAIGCWTDRMVTDRLTRAWVDFNGLIWDVAEKYSYELYRYRILLQYHKSIDDRRKVFERYAKINMRYAVDRKFVIEDEIKQKEYSEKQAERLMSKWDIDADGWNIE